MPGATVDFNALLRESRHLEAAMEGVSNAFAARPAGAASAAGGANAALGLSGGATGALSAAVRVPALQRNLTQLSAASRRLARQQLPTDALMDSQAQLLLATKGIDLRAQQRALKEIELALPVAQKAMHGGPMGMTGAGVAGAAPAGIESFHPLDIDRFLQHQQQRLCHEAMEEAAKVTSDNYRLHDLSSLADDWEVSKREILDSLGFRGGKSALGEVATQPMLNSPTMEHQQRQNGTSGALQAGPTGPVLGMEQAIYARAIQELNHSRVRRAPFRLLATMKTAAHQIDEYFAGAPNALAPGDVADCWDVLACMLQDNATDAMNGKASELTEKMYSGAWNAPAGSGESRALQQQLVEGARVYSQQLFEAYVRSVVTKYPEARKVSHGKPTFAQLVATYVSIRAAQAQLPPATRDVLLDGVPFWPQVYFCFRCGRLDAALELLHRHTGQGSGVQLTGFGRTGSTVSGANAAGAGGFGSHDQQHRALVEAMEKRATGGAASSLHAALWTSLHEEYQRELGAAVNSARAHGGGTAQAGAYADPFKLALYHLLGRFRLPQFLDIAQHVAPTTEDYLWLKLTVLGDTASETVGMGVPDALREQVDGASTRLSALQADLLARGESSFNPDGRHPLTYFKVLLLSQQFEQAVYYLIKTPFFTVGVHFAIVLEYYGCLRTHQNSAQELLIAVPSASPAAPNAAQRYAVNYARILRKYVEAFVRTHPFEAFHYLYLLHTAHSGAGVARRRGIGSFAIGAQDDMDDTLPSAASASGGVTPDASFAAIRDLLLETKEYDLLVGTIVSNAGSVATIGGGGAAVVDTIQTQRGLLYNYYTRAEAQYLLVHTASMMETHGLTSDAVQLYLLAYRFDLAIELLLRSLAPLVAASVQSAERSRLVERAQQVQRVVRNTQGQLAASHGSRNGGAVEGEASESSQRALHQLLLLVNYFDLYHLGPAQYESALVLLFSSDLALLPSHAAEASQAASAYENPSVTHAALKRCISDVAISAMDIYYVQYQMVKREMASSHGAGGMQYAGAMTAQRDQARQQRLAALRSQARALVSFLGLIHASMQVDADVYGKLVAIEALMAA